MKQLRKSEIKEINSQLSEQYGVESYFDVKGKLIRKDDFLVHDNSNAFFLHEDRWIPTLRTILKNNFLKKVTVDMGAIKFVTNGADIMRPGVVGCDSDIVVNQAVVIVDETHGKPLAVGLALFPSEELMAQSSGKVVKTLHYVGDEIWG